MDDQDLLFPSLPAGKKWGGKDDKEIVFMKLSEAPTFPPIKRGLKVQTPKGPGTVNYARMAQPIKVSGNRWEAASVRLEGALNGTIYPAEEIELLEEW